VQSGSHAAGRVSPQQTGDRSGIGQQANLGIRVRARRIVVIQPMVDRGTFRNSRLTLIATGRVLGPEVAAGARCLRDAVVLVRPPTHPRPRRFDRRRHTQQFCVGARMRHQLNRQTASRRGQSHMWTCPGLVDR